MNDPPRLLDGAGGELARELLGSALHDTGSAQAYRRVQGIVSGGVAVGVFAEASAAAGATKATVATPLLVLKWVALGALAGTVVAGTATVAVAPARSTSQVIATTVVNPVETGPQSHGDVPVIATSEPASVLTEPVVERDAPSLGRRGREQRPVVDPATTIAASPAAVAASPRTLAEEIALVDSARTALARGDAATALADIGRHDVDFPGGALALDAGVLRVRALFMAGRRADGEREAARLLAANPTGPYAARVRELLGRVNP